MGNTLLNLQIDFKPLKPHEPPKKVTDDDKEHIRQIVKKVDGEELPNGWFETMDVVKWVSDTEILIGTYAPLSDREWIFDMENNTYRLSLIS